jgi:uncharacterized protein YciI
MKRTRPISISLIAILLGAAIPVSASDPPGAFEMTTYYVAFLYRGPAWSPEETPERARIQEGHMANIRKMGESGKLLVAGPFTDDGDLRGLFVFRTGSLEEAKAMAEQDPAVKAGRLRLEWHPWFAAKNISVTAKAAPAK